MSEATLEKNNPRESKVYRAFIKCGNEFLLLRCSGIDEKSKKGKWDSPGGRMESKNETIEELLSDEIGHKTGIEISPEQLKFNKRYDFDQLHKNKIRRFINVVIEIDKKPDEITFPFTFDAAQWVIKDQALSMNLRERTRRAIEGLF